MRALETISLLSLFLFFPVLTAAAGPLDVVLNEIAWMGGVNSSNDEWIELYNNTAADLDISGWELSSEDKKLKIVLEGKIPGDGFFLLERTDDNAVPNIPANQVHRGALNNKGEYLKLIDEQGNSIDEVNCSNGWFAGNNKIKQTMERSNALINGNNPENWHKSQNPGGTPNQPNSQAQNIDSAENLILNIKENSSTSASLLTEQPDETKPEDSVNIVYPQNVFINEILASPEGSDSENEWVEIYNANSFEVDLSSWQIRDKIGAIKTYTFPNGTKIKPDGFLICPRTKTGISLQNNGDGLELLNPKEEIVHRLNYEIALKGQSFNRKGETGQWNVVLTPGKENIFSSGQSNQKENSPDLAKKEEQEVSSSTISYEPDKNKKMLANIEKTMPRPLNPVILLLAALGIAIASGIVVLIIKKRAE